MKKYVDWEYIFTFLLIILCVILFKGEPDIADSLRIAADRWANS